MTHIPSIHDLAWSLYYMTSHGVQGREGVLAAIYTREGRRMLREGEVEEELGRLRRELERMQRLLDERQGEQTT